jgi:hypothetical protein
MLDVRISTAKVMHKIAPQVIGSVRFAQKLKTRMKWIPRTLPLPHIPVGYMDYWTVDVLNNGLKGGRSLA